MKNPISLILVTWALCGCAAPRPAVWSEEGVVPAAESPPASASLSPGEKLFVAHFVGDYDLSIIDRASREVERLVSFRSTNAISVAPNPLLQEVYVAVENGSAFYVVDVLAAKVKAFPRTVGWNSNNSVVDPGGQRVYLSTSGAYGRAPMESQVLAFDTGSRAVVQTTKLGSYDQRRTNPIELSPDGQKIYAIDNTSGKLFVIQAENGTIEQTIDSPGRRILGIEPDGTALYVSGDQGVSKLRVDRWTETWSVPAPSHVAAIGSGRLAALVEGKVLLLDSLSGEIVFERKVRSPSGISFSLDQSEIYVSSGRMARVHLLKAESGAKVGSIKLLTGSFPNKIAAMQVETRTARH
ncbi:MAG: YncE family protein [Acidobacteriota bacterium]